MPDQPAPLYPSDPPDHGLAELLADMARSLGNAVVRHLPRRRP